MKKVLEHRLVMTINFVEKLGREFAEQHPEMIDVYLKEPNVICRDLAKRYFPTEYKTNSQIAENAVHHAISILSKDKVMLRKVGRNKNFRKSLKKWINEIGGKEGTKSEAYRKSCSLAGYKSFEANGIDSKGMLLAQGRLPYEKDERQFIFKRIKDKRYQWEKGSNKGRPKYQLISEELNSRFHSGRTATNLCIFVSDSKRAARRAGISFERYIREGASYKQRE